MFYYDPIEEYGFGGYLLDSLNSSVDYGGDIVVTGPSYGSSLFSFGYSTWNESSDALGWFMYDQLPTDLGGGSVDINFDSAVEFERLIDSAAADAVQRIRAESDDHRIEYGYFIIRDANGVITLSQRHTSNLPNEINFGGSLSLAETGAIIYLRKQHGPFTRVGTGRRSFQ